MQHINGNWCNKAVAIHTKKWDRHEGLEFSERKRRRAWNRLDRKFGNQQDKRGN